LLRPNYLTNFNDFNLGKTREFKRLLPERTICWCHTMAGPANKHVYYACNVARTIGNLTHAGRRRRPPTIVNTLWMFVSTRGIFSRRISFTRRRSLPPISRRGSRVRVLFQ